MKGDKGERVDRSIGRKEIEERIKVVGGRLRLQVEGINASDSCHSKPIQQLWGRNLLHSRPGCLE